MSTVDGILRGMTLLDRPGSPLVLDQCGVLATAQAVAAFGRTAVRGNISTRRWQRPTRGVVVMHNGPLTVAQHDWVAQLSCPRHSALGGRTALGWDGFEGFAEDRPHVVLPEGANRPTNTDVVPHFSTMLDDRDVHPLHQPRLSNALGGGRLVSMRSGSPLYVGSGRNQQTRLVSRCSIGLCARRGCEPIASAT